MLRIVNVIPGSKASELGFEKGDIILSINGQLVNDVTDYIVLRDAREVWEILNSRDKSVYEIEIERDNNFGLEFSEPKWHRCTNNCVFCFVDQNPPELRKTVYFKDEDFRLSYLTGSYITLSNISKRSWERIVSGLFSPLYISIHSLNSNTRQKLLGCHEKIDIRDKLIQLKECGINFHAQIVVVPGYNDGDDLKETLEACAEFYPNLCSISVIPVGLTCHRKHLVDIKPVDQKTAKRIIMYLRKTGEDNIRRFGKRIIFPSDEMFLIAGEKIPGRHFYEDFPQLENGVGLISDFMNSKKPAGEFQALFLTGKSFEPYLKDYLSKVKGALVLSVRNKTFGDSVNVAGLLTGKDIMDFLIKIKPEKTVYIPDICLNDDYEFLDNIKLVDIEKKLNISIKAIDKVTLDRLFS
ncbi:MAG: DUF512 domain-containing protein [Candidatus Coatesbacteria bacterium]|nr:DUF512 domain-containing protein [Candidatus Coatesbacteria bacterium]